MITVRSSVTTWPVETRYASDRAGRHGQHRGRRFVRKAESAGAARAARRPRSSHRRDRPEDRPRAPGRRALRRLRGRSEPWRPTVVEVLGRGSQSHLGRHHRGTVEHRGRSGRVPVAGFEIGTHRRRTDDSALHGKRGRALDRFDGDLDVCCADHESLLHVVTSTPERSCVPVLVVTRAETSPRRAMRMSAPSATAATKDGSEAKSRPALEVRTSTTVVSVLSPGIRSHNSRNGVCGHIWRQRHEGAREDVTTVPVGRSSASANPSCCGFTRTRVTIHVRVRLQERSRP